jgi:hypothetical protein
MGLRERGFFSIDALFAVTLLLMVSVSFLNIYEGRKQATELMGARLEARIVGEKLAAAINTVYAGRGNFELRVGVPPKIVGFSYSITFDNAGRDIIVENLQNFGRVRVGVACKNVVVNIDNFFRPIRVYWFNDNVVVVNA